MAEISINKVIAFDRGYIVEATTLTQGNTYELNISDGIVNTTRTYIPSLTGKSIIDSWGGLYPSGNVCFTLSDSTIGCPPVSCSMQVI